MFRILINSMRVALRSRRRFIAFTIIYAILIMWIGITLRTGSLATSLDGWFSITAGAIVAILYAFLLSYFRRDDIATLKQIGTEVETPAEREYSAYQKGLGIKE